MSHTCPTCGVEFDSSRGLRVHHAQAHGETLPNRECLACGENFYSKYEQRYCSEECREAAVSFAGEDNPNYRGGKETTECEICGERFEYYASDKEGLYCSDCVETENWRHRPDLSGEDNPHWKGGKQAVDCDVCGETVERHPHRLTGEAVLCSEECQAEWLSDAFTGEGHPNWRGGGNANYGPGWNAVRRAALERDDHRCVACGTTPEDREPDVHHLVPVRAFEAADLDPSDAHRLDNVVALCVRCHRKAEFGRIGRERLRALAGIG